jgi:hypothetical protein
MSPSPAPPPRERAPSEQRAEDQDERYGALALTRRLKEDGRALILYTRLATRAGGAGAGGSER